MAIDAWLNWDAWIFLRQTSWIFHQNDGKVTVTSILNERLAIAILEK